MDDAPKNMPSATRMKASAAMMNNPQMLGLMRTVENEYGFSYLQIVAKDNTPEVTKTRHMVWLIANEAYGLSSHSISELFDRDRSTITHGIQKAKRLTLSGDISMPNEFFHLIEKVKHDQQNKEKILCLSSSLDDGIGATLKALEQHILKNPTATIKAICELVEELDRANKA